MWKSLILVVGVGLAAYRVWLARDRTGSVSQTLGVALDRSPLTNVVVGALITMIAIGVVFAVQVAAGMTLVDRIGSGNALLADIASFLIVPFIEEFVFRCGILGALLAWIPRSSVAVLISAMVFGGLHAANPHASVLSVASTTLGGIAYGMAFASTRRIWLPLGLHFGWNYAEGRVFGFHLSGGAVRGPAPFVQQHDLGPPLLTGGEYGPEGGLIGIGARLLVLALLAAWISLQRRKSEAGQIE